MAFPEALYLVIEALDESAQRRWRVAVEVRYTCLVGLRRSLARYTRVEPDAMAGPSVGGTHCLGELARVVVRVMVSERILRVPEQVLAVKNEERTPTSFKGPNFFLDWK